MFSSVMMMKDERPVQGESLKQRSDSLNFSKPLGDGAVGRSIVLIDTIQLLTELRYIEPFPSEKLDDRIDTRYSTVFRNQDK